MLRGWKHSKVEESLRTRMERKRVLGWVVVVDRLGVETAYFGKVFY